MLSHLGYKYVFGEEIGNGGFGRVTVATREGGAGSGGIEYAAKIFIREEDGEGGDEGDYSSNRRIDDESDVSGGDYDTSSDTSSDTSDKYDPSIEVGVLRELTSLKMLCGEWGKTPTPHILPILDVGVYAPTKEIYMIMPRMKCDLHVAIKDKLIPGLRTKVKIAHGILMGLAHLHVNNVIHRDIKTENILLDNDFNPYIADFSLAKIFSCYENEKDHTHTGDVGTEVFRAPEVIRGDFYDKSADMYACGVIFMEIFNSMIQTRKDSVARRYIIESMDKMPTNSLVKLIKGLLCDSPSSRYTYYDALESDVFKKLYDSPPLLPRAQEGINKKINPPKVIKKYMSKKQKKAAPKILKDEVHLVWVQLTFENTLTKDAARIYHKKIDGKYDVRYCVLVASKLYESQLLSITFIESAINNFDPLVYKEAEECILKKMDYDIYI